MLIQKYIYTKNLNLNVNKIGFGISNNHNNLIINN